jgi:hypothetical protein
MVVPSADQLPLGRWAMSRISSTNLDSRNKQRLFLFEKLDSVKNVVDRDELPRAVPHAYAT